jgi:hypothetical protein
MMEEKVEVHHPAEGDDEEEHLGPRVRKLTEKGLKYTLETKFKRLRQLCRSLEKNSDDVLELMDADGDQSGIQKGYKQWIALFDEFLTVNEEYENLLSPEERLEHEQDWFDARYQVFIEFKAKAAAWFAKGPKENMSYEKHREPEDPDRISIKTSSTSTYSSRHSSKSSRSIKSARLVQEQVKAKLEVKLTSLIKRKQLEEEKVRLHIQEEELKLQEELAISQAQCKALGDIDDKSVSRGGYHGTSGNSDSTALMAVVRHLNKPTSEIRKFGGNPLEYHRFLRQFQSRIVSNCDSFDEKLNFLEQYTIGEAAKVVSGYSQMKNSKEAYQWALKVLEERYGDSDVVVNAYIQKALNWPIIKADNPKSLDEFAIFLLECEHAVQNVESIRVLEYTDNFRKIVSKLPYNMHDKWRSVVQDKKDRGIRLSFSHLVKFVSKEAQKVNDPTFGKEAMKPDQDKHAPQQCSSRVQRTKAIFATKLTEVRDDSSSKSSAFVSPCLYCNGHHALQLCRHLFDLPYYDRIDIIKSKGCCFGCLRFGHQRKFCKNKSICTHCQGRHPSVLHVNGKPSVRDSVLGTRADCNVKVNTFSGACTDSSYMYNNRDNVECTMAIIPVKVRISGSNIAVTTYAFLDPGSNVSFCTAKLMCQLGIEGKRMRLRMDTMGEPHSMYSYELNGLEIIDLDEKSSIPLPPIYTKDEMPVSRCHIPTSEDMRQWPHLHDIKLPHINAEVGLLLGNNISDASTPLEVRVGPRGTPYATRSVLGWIPWNIVRTGSNNVHTVNRADVMAIEQLHEIKDLNKLYVQSVNLDFPERNIDDRKEPSPEDNQFMTKMIKSQKIVNGHYELCLPFRDDNPSLPDNKFMALQRLETLRKKMLTNSQFCDDYQSFMQTLLDEKYAERVSGSALLRTDGKTWYLPHHGVYNPNKPNKIRVVFDCSAKCRGISLNNKLLQGPDLTNPLIGVLLKFRQEAVAIQGDIEKMFYQVRVAQDDRDCLRYFWWPNGDLGSDPVIYRMTVHIFGAVSSPSCANFALQQTIQNHRKKFEPCIGQFATTHFYVDDLLC